MSRPPIPIAGNGPSAAENRLRSAPSRSFANTSSYIRNQDPSTAMTSGMPIKAEAAAAKPPGRVLAAAMLSLAILALPGRSEAATAACPAATHPAKVTVTPMLPAPLEDQTTSYHDLTKEMSFKKLKPEEDAMGVSSSSLGYDLHAEFRIATRASHSCAYLTSLAVQFGYTRRLVQIAAEVPKDSCMYGEIREHEYKH